MSPTTTGRWRADRGSYLTSYSDSCRDLSHSSTGSTFPSPRGGAVNCGELRLTRYELTRYNDALPSKYLSLIAYITNTLYNLFEDSLLSSIAQRQSRGVLGWAGLSTAASATQIKLYFLCPPQGTLGFFAVRTWTQTHSHLQFICSGIISWILTLCPRGS